MDKQKEFEKELYNYSEYAEYADELCSEPIAKFISRDNMHGIEFDQYTNLSKTELEWKISRYGEFDICNKIKCEFDTYYYEYLVEYHEIQSNTIDEILKVSNEIKAFLINKDFYINNKIKKQIASIEKNIKIPFCNLSELSDLCNEYSNLDDNICKYVVPNLFRKVILATITKDSKLMQECCKIFHTQYIQKNL